MRTEEEIRNKIKELCEIRSLKITRACVGYRENIKATIAQCTGGIEQLKWVLNEGDKDDR